MTLNYGLKISTPGNDVKTQSDQALAFHSKYPSLKLIKSGDISVTTDGSGNGTQSVAHNFGFRPAFFSFQKRTVSWSLLDGSSYTNAYVPDPGTGNQWGGDYHHYLHVYTDTTNIYLEAKGAQASTTYTIHYLLFADLAEDYSGADFNVDDDYGFKVSREGINVLTAKQYQLAYSSRYKAIQYYDVSYKTTTLVLPTMWASPIDTPQEEGTYVDILHGLGYPPFFLSFYRRDVGDPISYSAPYLGLNPSTDDWDYGIGAFCDATRVRLSFWRKSTWGLFLEEWPAETVYLKCYIFTEDLSQSFDGT